MTKVDTNWTDDRNEQAGSWSDITRNNTKFSGRGERTETITLDPVPYNSTLVTYDDNNCLYNGPQVTITYTTQEKDHEYNL